MSSNIQQHVITQAPNECLKEADTIMIAEHGLIGTTLDRRI